MIPEESFNFNRCNPSGNFDQPEVRWPHRLQQDAVPALKASRNLLAFCPICKRPWYKAGRQEYPRLTPMQLAFLGAALQVDIQALYLLPKAFCTICSTIHLGGMFSAEVYPRQSGYHFLWESASPRRIQLQAMVYRAEGHSLDALMQMAPETCAEPSSEMLSVLAWLEICPSSEGIQTLTVEQRQHLARRCPPGYTMSGSPYQWHGYAWKMICPPLGGKAQVTLAVALPWQTLPPYKSLRFGWAVLARALRAVL